ncbi:MAG: hypothetical protein ACI9U2_002825 [Bradymonadia bacterium]
MRGALALTAVVFVLGCSSGCGTKPKSPEAAVRQTVSAIEKAVEEKDLDAIIERVAKGYRDKDGNNRKGLRAMLAMRFFRQGSIHAVVRVSDVQFPAKTTAVAKLAIAVAGTPLPENGVLDGLRADIFDMTITLTLNDDAWQVSGARWNRGGRDLFE